VSLPHPILAIDHGAARIGIAATDPVGIMPHPIETVPSNDDSIKRIVELITQREVQSILVGLPLHMDGSEGKSALKVRRFTNLLKKALPQPLPVEFIDESKTTIEASDKLRESGKKAKQQKEIIDQASAVEILNRYLQSQENPFGLLEDPDQFS